MKSWSDTLIGITLIAVLVGYFMLNQTETARSEAILGELSQIMNDLEQTLRQKESYPGMIPADIPLTHLLKSAQSSAMVTTAKDPSLMPDMQEDEASHRVTIGGCPLSGGNYALLRYDHVALTEIPEIWRADHLKICLDRNGALPPNREGYDVIWLSVSRQGSPHVTLIPVNSVPQSSLDS